MAVYKRGKTYWFEFKFDGRRVRESAKTSNKRVAEQIEAARKTQLAKREVGLDIEKVVVPAFPDAVEQYLAWSMTEHALAPSTTKRYETASKPLLRFLVRRESTALVLTTLKNTRYGEVGKRKGLQLENSKRIDEPRQIGNSNHQLLIKN